MIKKINVKIKLLDLDAKVPRYGSDEAAGFDVYSVEDVEIKSGEIQVVRTGIAMEIEEGYCWQFWDRSGLAKKGIHHLGGLGDSDYRGEFKVVLHNASSENYKIEKGDRIIQIVPVPIVRAEFEEVSDLSETVRGENGFHSTGKK